MIKNNAEIGPIQLKKWLDEGIPLTLVDVRQPAEYEAFNIGGKLIPLDELPNRHKEIDSHQKVVMLCRLGRRSAEAVAYCKKLGFKHIWSLKGGLTAWAEVFPEKRN